MKCPQEGRRDATTATTTSTAAAAAAAAGAGAATDIDTSSGVRNGSHRVVAVTCDANPEHRF